MLDEVSDRGRARAIIAETQELFDCTVDELYKAHGARKGDLSRLHPEAQKAYAATEILTTHQLNSSDPFDGEQDERDAFGVETTRAVSRSVRKWLPW
jgi:hypothetical protein